MTNDEKVLITFIDVYGEENKLICTKGEPHLVWAMEKSIHPHRLPEMATWAECDLWWMLENMPCKGEEMELTDPEYGGMYQVGDAIAIQKLTVEESNPIEIRLRCVNWGFCG